MLQSAHKRVIYSAAPEDAREQKQQALGQLGSTRFHFGGTIEARIGSDALKIPDRITFSEKIKTDDNLVSLCLRTRSHDGYERETALKKLVTKTSLPLWVQLYLFLELADYVKEASTLPTPENFRPLHKFQSLLRQNKELTELTKQRIISYWNEFYREAYKDLSDYPPYKVFQELNRELTDEEPILEIEDSMPEKY